MAKTTKKGASKARATKVGRKGGKKLTEEQLAKASGGFEGAEKGAAARGRLIVRKAGGTQ